MRQFPWAVFVFAAALLPGGWAETPEQTANAPIHSDLPVIDLAVKGPLSSEAKTPCTLKLVLPKESSSSNLLTGVIRFHGASSQGYPKKSFGIMLSAPVQWLGMRESSHWVLNAAFVDRSLMRHKLSYDLFQSLAATNAPRFAAASRFVELNLNRNYEGVYLLMERVDRSLLGLRRFETNATQHACVYKAIDHSAGFDHSGHWGFEQREPDPLGGEYWGPLDRFNRFVSSADKATFFDPLKGIASRLDLDNTIDFHLLVLLTQNVDGFDKNLILARDAPFATNSLPRFFFVPWDYDATFGRTWEGSRVGSTEWLSNHLFDRLLEDAAYRRKFAARWKQLRQRQFSVATIHQMIDANVKILGGAVDRNADRWRAAEDNYPDRLTFREDIRQMKEWIVRRTTWLDRQIAQIDAH